MRNKKVLMLLAITVVLSGSLTACSFGGGDNDEDTSVVQVTPTPEPTKAPKRLLHRYRLTSRIRLIHPRTRRYPLSFRMLLGQINQILMIW